MPQHAVVCSILTGLVLTRSAIIIIIINIIIIIIIIIIRISLTWS